MPIGAILTAASLAAKAAPAVIAAVKGPAEKAYRQRIQSDIARLARTGGGMAAGQLTGYQAAANQAINANRNMQMAEIARGASLGQGQSGATQQAIKAANTAAQQAGARAASDIRAQDVALGAQTAAGLDQRLAQARAMGAERKAQALGQWKTSVSPQEAQEAFNLGQGEREKKGAVIETEAALRDADREAAALGLYARQPGESAEAYIARIRAAKAELAKTGS